ncbi:hypothetical protein [Rhodococcus sp. NPDC058514]|uniref:hypothetical protein n=1 Tax=unclassified Rhodococcus (in: high G+C Gram-positive bacteria) TaxID=192944 RepID=UPI0036600D15
MSRTLARRGASVFAAMALLGGGLALGGGTASADDLAGGAVGSVEEVFFGGVITLGIVGGSIDQSDIWIGCAGWSCPATPPSNLERFTAWLQGIDPATAFPPVRG